MLKLIILLILIVIIIIYVKFRFFTRRELYNYDIPEFLKIKSLNDIKIYVINMKNQPERKEHMIKLLKSLEFNNYEFVTPVRLDKCQRKVDKLKLEKCNSRIMSGSLTLIKILRKASKSNERFLVFEDDISIVKRKNNITFEKIYDQGVDHNADLIYFEYCGEYCYRSYKVGEIFKLYSPMCSAAISYSPQIAKYLVDNFENTYEGELWDLYLKRLIKTGKLKAYGYRFFIQDGKFQSSLNYKISNLISPSGYVQDCACRNFL